MSMTCSHRTSLYLPTSNVLTIQDAQGRLQGLDFLLARLCAVLEALTTSDARWLELLEVVECGIQFLLGALQIGFLVDKLLRFLLFAGSLVLDVGRLASLVHLGVMHEGIVLTLCLILCGGSGSLKASEVCLDDLQHADDTARFGSHAGIWLVEDFWLSLHEGSSLTCLGIELSQDNEGLCYCSLGTLRIRNCFSVLVLLLLAEVSCFCDTLVQISDCSIQLGKVLSQLGNGCIQHVDLGSQCLHCFGLVLTCLTVC